MSDDRTRDEKLAVQVLRDLLATREAYHHHKEVMAYSGLALWLGAVTTALFTLGWPARWFGCDVRVPLALVTVTWLLVLFYIRWQLLNRRWAAIQSAGIERVLASWIYSPPETGDLHPYPSPGDASDRRRQGWPRFIRWPLSFVWPCQGSEVGWYAEADVREDVYPCQVQEEWRRQRTIGTGAIRHERLVFVAGWLFYAALIVRTGIKSC